MKPCIHCGQTHSAGAWRVAEILVPALDNRGRTGATIKTSWGKKTRCGVAAMIDEETHTPDLITAAQSILDQFIHQDGDEKGNKARTNIFKHCPGMGNAAARTREAIDKATNTSASA